MSRRNCWVAAGLALGLLGGLAGGCGGGDDDDTESATVAEICAKVLTCDGGGWADQADCEAGWINSSLPGTACHGTAGYLECMAGCVLLQCEAFFDCEPPCWDRHCPAPA